MLLFPVFAQTCILVAQTSYTKRHWVDLIWKPPPHNWVKINVDMSRRISIKSTFIRYVMRDNHTKIVMTKGKPIGDSPILIANV